MKTLSATARWLCAIAVFIPALASAKVTEFVIESTESLYGSDPIGNAGPYEKLRGYAVGELDPDNPQNAVILNLDKAERNANGLVEYRVDVEIHKPVDLERGNGTMLYDVVNRGRKLALGRIRLEDGFTFVWSGWQGDLVRNGERLTASFPIAVDEFGDPVIGLAREEFIEGADFVGDLPYPATTDAMANPSLATLTVRENERDPRVPLNNWSYVNDRQISVMHPGLPYDAGAIFEFIYPATGSILHAIGFAATRDVNSFLRYGIADSKGNPNPLAGMDRAMAMGISQSGRMLRHFLYLGFNQDEEAQQVFDGAFPIIPGSRKTWTNTLFANPGWWSKQHEQHLQAGDQFPFAYSTITNPLTGETDGIMRRCRETNTCPKIMHMDGEFEVWGARGSLLLSDGDPAGPNPIDIPKDVRLYMVAGTPHGGAGNIVPASPPPFGICKNVLNPNGSTAVYRALVIALNEWISDGRKPPKSNYGSVGKKKGKNKKATFVTSDQASTGFPDIPGVVYNGIFNSIRVTDYTVQPPDEGDEYGVLVPRVDEDGNSLAGIRLPMQEAPIATYTGWNLRAPGYAEDEGCSSSGSYIPFPGTRAERLASGDPRLSIEERYKNKRDYLKRFAHAAKKLVKKRLLLPEDAAAMIEQAESLVLPLN